jgi:hypothetical protein
MKLIVSVLKMYFVTVHSHTTLQHNQSGDKFRHFPSHHQVVSSRITTKLLLQQSVRCLQCCARTKNLHIGPHDVHSHARTTHSGYHIYHPFNTQNLRTYSQTIYQCVTRAVVFRINTVKQRRNGTLCEVQILCLNTRWSESLCKPDDYSTKNTQKYFKQFQSLTTIT